MAKLAIIPLLVLLIAAQYVRCEDPPSTDEGDDSDCPNCPMEHDGYPYGHGDYHGIPPWLLPTLKGREGRPGRDGEKGMKGCKGEKGEKGIPGDSNDVMGMAGEKGYKGEKGVPGEDGEKGDRGTPGNVGTQGPAGTITSGGASTYVHWGRTDCMGTSTLVYSGRAVAPVFDNAGGGSQYLCLPDSRDAGGLPQNSQPGLSTLVGVHFETFSDNSDFPLSDPNDQEPLHAQDGNVVACAVCRTSNTAVMMIPNNRECPADTADVTWSQEYIGYLMAARDYIFLTVSGQMIEHTPVFGNTAADGISPPNFRTEYVCVNTNPSAVGVPGGSPTSEALLSHIRIYCRGLAGLDDISCIEFFQDQGAVCSGNDGHCALGPLGCTVCTANAVAPPP